MFLSKTGDEAQNHRSTESGAIGRWWFLPDAALCFTPCRAAGACLEAMPTPLLKRDPLETIIRGAEWLGRPRAGSNSKDGNSRVATASASSPTEREGGRGREFDRQLELRGGVWLGHLRVCDDPWGPVMSKRRTLMRDERARPHEHESLANLSRADTSVSDDGSGASDGNDADVTLDENTSGMERGVDLMGSGQAAVVDSRARTSETKHEHNERSGGTLMRDAAAGETSAGEARDVQWSGVDGALGGAEDGVGRRRGRLGSDSSRSHKGSFRGSDREGFANSESVRHVPRKWSKGHQQVTTGNSFGEHILCGVIAKPPSAGCGVPGTANGEGHQRALAAGSTFPLVLDGRLIAPGNPGWPHQWNPVALLRLFPTASRETSEEVRFAFPRSSDCLPIQD